MSEVNTTPFVAAELESTYTVQQIIVFGSTKMRAARRSLSVLFLSSASVRKRRKKDEEQPTEPAVHRFTSEPNTFLFRYSAHCTLIKIILNKLSFHYEVATAADERAEETRIEKEAKSRRTRFTRHNNCNFDRLPSPADRSGFVSLFAFDRQA